MLGRYSNQAEHLKRLKRVVATVSRASTVHPTDKHVAVHKVSQRHPPSVLDQLAAEYIAGVPTTELSTRYKLGKGAVLRVLESRGVTMRRQPLTDEQTLAAAGLYEGGASLKSIAEELGVDHETVRKAVRRAGVQMRKPWERGIDVRR